MTDNKEHDHCCSHGDHEHDEHCDCSHTMKLLLEDGSRIECDVIEIFSADESENEYIALLPQGSEEVLLYRYVEAQDGSFSLENIESEDEFDAVEEAFFDMLEDEDDFEEEYEFEEED